MLAITIYWALAVQCVLVLAGNDWIDPNYLIAAAQQADPAVNAAKLGILADASSSAQGGPWSVTKGKIRAPSGDPRDYLSWAPYHWPDCSTCDWNTNGRAIAGVSEALAAPSSSAKSAKQSSSSKVKPLDGTSSTTEASTSALPSSTSIPRAFATLEKGSKKCYCKNSKAKRGIASKANKSTCIAPELGLPDSATWYQCDYVTRDGQVNPDVRTLETGAYVGYTAISSLSNSIAYALNGSSIYAKTASEQLYTMFGHPELSVYPRLDYAQIVRGKGKTSGSFMGVLDFRSMVKVANAVQILRQTKAPEWTQEYDTAMLDWADKYLEWLSSSAQGKKASQAPNNHGSFYYNQFAALKMVVGDMDGAKKALQSYFDGAFKDQIADDGSQPGELARTRPYHYSCFNLEAIITNAKLGHTLGMDFWSYRSSNNATIQTAADYIMKRGPNGESVTELIPHLAAISAVYGDPDGAYKAFMMKNMPDYQEQAFWFFDQPSVFTKARMRRDVGDWERAYLWTLPGFKQRF